MYLFMPLSIASSSAAVVLLAGIGDATTTITSTSNTDDGVDKTKKCLNGNSREYIDDTTSSSSKNIARNYLFPANRPAYHHRKFYSLSTSTISKTDDDKVIESLWEEDKNEHATTIQSTSTTYTNDKIQQRQQNDGKKRAVVECEVGILSSSSSKQEEDQHCAATNNNDYYQRKLYQDNYFFTRNCIDNYYENRICDCDKFNPNDDIPGTLTCTKLEEYCLDYPMNIDCGTITRTYIFQYDGPELLTRRKSLFALKESDTVEAEYSFVYHYGYKVTSIHVDGCPCSFQTATCPGSSLTCPGLPTVDDICDRGFFRYLWSIDPMCGPTAPVVVTQPPVVTHPPVPPVTPPSTTPPTVVTAPQTVPSTPIGLVPIPLQPIIGDITVPSPDPSPSCFLGFICPSMCIFGFICICFSGTNHVHVQGQGMIQMNELQIGDFVMVQNHDDNINEMVYHSRVISFSHRDESSVAEFIQVYTEKNGTIEIKKQDQQPLEISHDHMIQMSKANFIKARDLRIGDALYGGNVVVNISTTTSRGLYAPVTETGTIVVSGVTASNYVAILDYIPTTGQHYSAHALYALVRWRDRHLRLNKKPIKESYTEDGLSVNYVITVVKIVYMIGQCHPAVQILSALFLSPAILLVLTIEQIFLLLPTPENLVFSLSILIVLLFFIALKRNCKKKILW